MPADACCWCYTAFRMGQLLCGKGTVSQSLQPLVTVGSNGINFAANSFLKPPDNWENKNMKCKIILLFLGLGLLQSLQTVHLSFNGILQIDLNDFHNCSQLKNIYLQNNKIANIHPDAFKDLNKLQVALQQFQCFVLITTKRFLNQLFSNDYIGLIISAQL